MFGGEQVEVLIVNGPSSTVATAFSAGFTATAEAKRCPADTDDPEVGTTLAVGRALQILGEDMERFAIARSHRQHHG